jgi:mannose-6-phosphate isomerase-like protein (cupin superfamily)
VKPKVIEKPWGKEEIWAETEFYVGKVLYIEPGHRLSLQHHEEKTETIRVGFGELELEYGPSPDKLEKITLGPLECFHIPAGMVHRMKAIGMFTEVFEVSTPHLDDVVRHSDDYGRE